MIERLVTSYDICIIIDGARDKKIEGLGFFRFDNEIIVRYVQKKFKLAQTDH